jgi:dolichol-phosphate mannosyltransferase
MNTLTTSRREPALEAARIPVDFREHKLWVVLPAYNEETGLPLLLEKIRQVFEPLSLNYEVVVVDDASKDNTGAVASSASFHMPLRLVTHQSNQGLAGALRSGFREVLGAGASGDVIVTLDADNTQQPGTILRLLQMVQDGYDVVIASRYQPGSRVLGVPPHRLLMTFGARWLFRLLLPIPGVRDYTCGFRAYRFDALQMAAGAYGESFVSEKGFSCMVDVLLKMRHFNLVFGEVPMLLRYDQKDGPSKMKVVKTMIQTIRLLLRRRFERPPAAVSAS